MIEALKPKTDWLRCPKCGGKTRTQIRPHGAGGLSPVLPKVPVYLRDPIQGWKNKRDRNAGRLDAVQTEKHAVCAAFIAF